MRDERIKRRHERVRLGGSARMMVDTSGGLQMTSGHIVDLSEGGCAVLCKTYVAANLCGRVQVHVAGVEMWIPVVTRWVKGEARGWVIGCAFDRPTDEKLQTIRALLWDRRKVTRDAG
jgi:hypothetical protein